ncbi:MAG: DUF4286 family protein [Bdellovibrionota bacterium]|nr:DUF4286 family protein [Deltaproteobacteria bacterium]
MNSSEAPLIYEVNLAVDLDIADAYALWLEPHIKEMLGFDGFISAQWYERNAQDEGLSLLQRHWTIHYGLQSRHYYERYINEHAPRMREDGLSKFAGKFQATRRILLSFKKLRR